MADRIHGGGNLDPRKYKSGLPRDAKRWALNVTAFQYAHIVAGELQEITVEFAGSRVQHGASNPILYNQ